MAKFIHCSVQKFRYFADAENHPINIDLVYMVKLWQNRVYPDNKGVPAIMFHFICGGHVIWQYPDAEAARDKDYENIVNNFI
jgi:hypothetical protein